jgi:dihydrofolate synthase/folylpolyglutamate synthase
LQKHFDFPMTFDRAKKGLRSRDWKGRMEFFHRGGRRFILDGAHNPISIKSLITSLRPCGCLTTARRKGSDLECEGLPRRPANGGTPRNDKKRKDSWLVFGAMNDKNSREMLKALSGFFSKVILTGIAGNRAKPVAMLIEEAKGLFKCILTAQNVEEAFELAEKASSPGASIVVTGSFYLVGEARKLLKTGTRTSGLAPRKGK